MSIARDETETAAMITIKTEAIPLSSLGRSGGAPDPSMVRAHKQADLSGSEAAEFEADDFRESDHDGMLGAEMTLNVDFIMQLQSTECFRFLRDRFVRLGCHNITRTIEFSSMVRNLAVP
ncbi:hypothetical protein BO79DRAFT_258876 [Aspergillus costaricaensis CBS 115574]|uniref:Uncharacterized protein n=1 Tax=Aspergillus costaricaensis CBS 115574 TaxID=1448317 RepID=A0ACD1I363_9EURO|nr:hypothetical protein BO79DRAFT_258876 [Aspergillus costaricaensis CBS 115574]RAK84902.1 hypothetical protein BO79DRAFT_258876 [Aspergillus costaricaensis CBS 115574]